METPFFFCGFPQEIAVTPIFDIFAEVTLILSLYFMCSFAFHVATNSREGAHKEPQLTDRSGF